MRIPLATQLHVLQLEDYSLGRLAAWLWRQRLLGFAINQKKAVEWTLKLRLLFWVALSVWVGLPFAIGWWISWWLGLVGFIVFGLLPYPLIVVASGLLYPLEWLQNNRMERRLVKELAQYPGITRVGITGSFGKTSTKQILHQILANKYYGMQTPASFNTPLGIARAVHLELNRHHDYFLVEMGAFNRRDIAHIASLVEPQFSLISGIGKQHLERFGSEKTILQTKFELVTAVEPQKALVNIDNPSVKSYLKDLGLWGQVKTYSVRDGTADFWVKSYELSRKGTDFVLHYLNDSISFHSPLFGTNNLSNTVGAIGMAHFMGMSTEEIARAVEHVSPAPHRMQLREVGTATVIDNAYSSNESGFLQSIDDLLEIPGKKAVVTPGLVELGDKTVSVHDRLGERMGVVFAKVVLVGKNERTASLMRGLKQAHRTIVVERVEAEVDVWSVVEQLTEEYDWVLLENDLPGNY